MREMQTKDRIRELVAELTDANKVALVRCEAGKPFGGDRVAIGRIRELGLVEGTSWSITEEGRQVVGALVGIPYKPVSVPKTSGSTPSKKGSNLFELGVSSTLSKAKAPRATVCAQCGRGIEKGSLCFWVEDEGIFHLECIDFS